ncbi:MAG: RecX family transcriptional regulator [Phycisphaeraceae bacterium]|nr:RecX family transcriptional regulator [Phycisphaeraceae bacterium]
MAHGPEQPELFGSAGAVATPQVVTRLSVLASGDISVFVGRRRVATLDPKAVHDLGLGVGSAWTPELEASIGLASETQRALSLSQRWLATRPRSVAEIQSRLASEGVSPGAADAALDSLVRAGLLDDVRLAGDLAAALATRGHAPEAIVVRLLARGLAAEIARDAADGVASPDPLRDARVLAASRLRSGGGSVESRARRAAAFLARRGFDAETVERAVHAALGDAGLRLEGSEF